MSGSVVTGEGGVWEDKTGSQRIEPYGNLDDHLEQQVHECQAASETVSVVGLHEQTNVDDKLPTLSATVIWTKCRLAINRRGHQSESS